MRCLNRNKRPFWYALYLGITPIIDEDGNDTGESEITYGNPVLSKANISAARGETATMQFGENEGYDKVIVMENPNVSIDEYTVLWIDTVPQIDAATGQLVLDNNGNPVTPWDYVVKKMARSLNSVSIAVSKVVVR